MFSISQLDFSVAPRPSCDPQISENVGSQFLSLRHCLPDENSPRDCDRSESPISIAAIRYLVLGFERILGIEFRALAVDRDVVAAGVVERDGQRVAQLSLLQ